MNTENNNLFADFDAVKNAGASSAESYLASGSLSGLTDSISPRFQGLIPEPTDALFDKMWESCGSLNNSVPSASAASLSGQTGFIPLSPDAFMSPSSVLEGRGSAPAFDDVLPERLRPVQTPSPQPVKAVPDEIAYFERLWETGEFPTPEINKTHKVSASDELGTSALELDNSQLSTLKSQSLSDSIEIPQLIFVKKGVKTQETKNDAEEKTSELTSKTEMAPSEMVQARKASDAAEKADKSQSQGSGWTLSVISCLIALFIGLFAFGWKALPAYLVQNQIQQATGLSLRMKNVSQDYRAGMTSVESIQAFDSAQRPFFETGHAAFSSLPYFVGDNQNMKWAMVEGIRFAPTPAYVNPNSAALSNNEFYKALQCVAKELDDSQIDLLVKNSVSTISTPYEQTVRSAEQEVKDITKQIQVLQERLLASGEEATDADKAQAASYQQRMKMALSNMTIEESQYNRRNTALLNNLRGKREQSRAENNIPSIAHGELTEYLFGQEYTEFTGQLLYEIRQFCRWLPEDLEKALGSVDKLDPSALSFRRIATQEPLAVGQLRLTGQTQFMNQTVPFSAVITNYSTKPNGKPLTLDVAFGEDQSARLRMEARRGANRTEIKVEFASSNVNPGYQFGLSDGLYVKLEPDEKTPFVQTRSIQFIVADGRIQGEYAMVQTAPSISIGVRSVHSENNAAKLNQLVQNVEKITLNGTISGQFAKPELRVSSNLESWGHAVLAIVANEYDARMDSYRTAIEQKSEQTIESEQKRIGKIAEDVKVSANGNALLLSQLSSGAVDSQITVEQTPSNVEQDLPDVPALETAEDKTDAPTIANSDEDLTLPSLEQLTPEETVVKTDASEDMAFPELPVVEPETAQPSSQIAAGDVILDELPPLEENATETNLNAAETAAPLTEQAQQTELVEEFPELPVLPSVEELLPVSESVTETQTPVVSQPSALPALPSLEELAPQAGVQTTAPMELQTSPDSAMNINSLDADYQSPEMEFTDDEPMEEALPEDNVEYIENAIPLVAPNTDSNVQRVQPPSLPVIIED